MLLIEVRAEPFTRFFCDGVHFGITTIVRVALVLYGAVKAAVNVSSHFLKVLIV